MFITRNLQGQGNSRASGNGVGRKLARKKNKGSRKKSSRGKRPWVPSARGEAVIHGAKSEKKRDGGTYKGEVGESTNLLTGF